LNNIKAFRQEKGMTVKELSQKSHVAVGYISDLENDMDGIKNPTKDVMIKIANALKKTVPEVFFPITEKMDKEVC
jgi:transcriptional regulator with XRE-family HTH domain